MVRWGKTWSLFVALLLSTVISTHAGGNGYDGNVAATAVPNKFRFKAVIQHGGRLAKGGGKSKSSTKAKKDGNGGVTKPYSVPVLQHDSGTGPFADRRVAKAGKPYLKRDPGTGKIDILANTEPVEPVKLPRRSPPPPGTIVNPVEEGSFGGCCTICTERFYRSLALLELPSHVELATLRNFHRAYDAHLSRHNIGFLESATSAKPPHPKAGADTEDKVTTGLDKGDLLHRIEDAANTIAAIGEDRQRIYTGQTGTGPCCRICPTTFVPYNHPKRFARNDISLPSPAGIVPAGEDGRFLMPTMLIETATSAKGTSRCCAVCVDESDGEEPRDRNAVGSMSFAEVKASVDISGKVENARRPGMCCTMCNEAEEDEGGGWSGMPPFSEPMSEAQAVETQATNEKTMEAVAHFRVFHPADTTSAEHKNSKSESSKQMESSSKRIFSPGKSKLQRATNAVLGAAAAAENAVNEVKGAAAMAESAANDPVGAGLDLAFRI